MQGRWHILSRKQWPAGLVLALLLSLAPVIGGCGARPAAPALSSKWASTHSGHYFGNPLGEAQPAPQPLRLEDPLSVRIRLLGMERPVGAVLEPLAARARLLTTVEGENPFLPTAVATQSARYGMGVEAEAFVRQLDAGQQGRTIPLADFNGVTVDGLTAYQELASGHAAADLRQLRVAVYQPLRRAEPARPATRPETRMVQLAILVQNPPSVAPLPGEGAPPASVTGPPAPTRETALVSQTLSAEGQTVVLLLPWFADDGAIQAIAAVIQLSPAEKDGRLEQKLKQMLADARQAADAAAKRQAELPPGTLDPVLMSSVVEALVYSENRRAALVYIAGRGEARICEQVAMTADDAFVKELSPAIGQALAARTNWTRTDAAWLLDRMAFERLARLSIQRQLSPELSGVLLTLAGEAGRSPAALEQILDNLSTRKDFENRLVAENFIALEDTSPSARVRAYDWLKAQGKEPQGYDPLAPSRQRRAAIEKAISQMNQPGAQP